MSCWASRESKEPWVILSDPLVLIWSLIAIKILAAKQTNKKTPNKQKQNKNKEIRILKKSTKL